MTTRTLDQNLRPIEELLHGAQRILIITHVAPDGDAIGSTLGLRSLLLAQGKTVTCACEDPIPLQFRYLPGSETFVQESNGSYELVISLDCSDRQRMGKVYTPALEGLPLLNVDHHVTNTRFGLVNWVDPESVATCQIILTLAESLGWPLSRQTATCLLTGLVTDTRAFRTSNVGLATMQAATRLMEAGASLTEITRQALDYRSLNTVYLWGRAFERIQIQKGILWTEVTRAMRRRCAVREEVSAGLSSFLSGVREAQVVVVFTERDNGTIDVSMRAAPGFNVAQVALKLGGGGHPQAAGCSLNGGLEQTKALVLSELRRSLDEQSRRQRSADG